MVIMHRIAARAWPLFCATALVSSATFAQESAEAAAQWNQQLLIAHKASDAHGVCEVYLRFKRWQQANWPEGAAAVARFFDTTVLPNFLQDRSKMEDKSAAQVETELLAFCTQAGEQSVAARNYFQAIADGQTEPPPAAEQREQAVGLRDSLISATFRGECMTVSPLFFEAPAAEKESITKFVHAEIYASDPQYRQETLDTSGMTDEQALAAVSEKMRIFKENEDREARYWRDCDRAETRFQSVIQRLSL
jgi:hypothetical protein